MTNRLIELFSDENRKNEKFFMPFLVAGDPNIDVRLGHPILGIVALPAETDGADGENYTQDGEMLRGTAGDSAGEWQLVDYNTFEIYRTPDKDYIPMITYVAYGGRRI